MVLHFEFPVPELRSNARYIFQNQKFRQTYARKIRTDNYIISSHSPRFIKNIVKPTSVKIRSHSLLALSQKSQN